MKRLPMRKIREALRLRADGFSGRRVAQSLVAQSLSVGRATISDYFRRADVEGLSWPLPDALSDADLEQRLFPYNPGEARGSVPQPDWTYVHAELRRKGVTLSLLWEEYRGVHPSRDIAKRCPAGQWMDTATAGTANFTRDGRESCRR